MKQSIIAVPALVGILSGAFLETPDRATTQIQRRVAVHSSVPSFKIDLDASEKEWVESHCQFGMPRLEKDPGYGPPWIIGHEGFVLQLSTVDKIPLWVCEKVTAEQLAGDAERQDRFKPDPDVPAYLQALARDYVRSGFDRGHQAPAADQKRSQRINDETFFFTNMSPQLGGLNRQIWKRLEAKMRDWVRTDQPVYIITGPLFWDPKEEEVDTSDGLVEHYSIGPGGVSVPTHFYKIALQKRANRWNAIAFVMANKEKQEFERLEDHRKSIDWIEERTGLDFFPAMPKKAEKTLEAAIPEMWE